jgi:hypothetical protein
MKKLMSIIPLLILSITAHADPQKADVDKWWAEFRAARDRTSDPLFISHFEKRRALTQEIENLQATAEKLFDNDKGKYSACLSTINWVKDYWMVRPMWRAIN